MSIFGRSARRFTKAESFQLFIEGLRSLQYYDDTADQIAASEKEMNRQLSSALKNFTKCAETYPDDILPRYYLGIVLSIQGQVVQARQLRAKLQGTKLGAAAEDPDSYFLQAAKAFEETANRSGKREGDLLSYAQYNQAQALAKTTPIVSINVKEY